MTKSSFIFTMSSMKKPKRLDFTEEEVDALITRVESEQLKIDDFPLLADILRAMIWLEHELKEKRLSIKRLRSIFGIKTERLRKLSKELLGKDLKENDSSGEDKEEEPAQGHGHRPSLASRMSEDSSELQYYFSE
jgi:hypothetical protein